jgi:magnesium transporter
LLGICDRKADTLLAFLLNHVTVSLVDSASRIEDMLEDLEEQLLDIKKNQLNFGEIIQGKRREYMTIKKSVLPLKEQFGKLLIINNPLINKDTLPLFRDANDQLQYVTQSMEGCREIISSLVDLYISNNDLRMNAIMKRLTVVSTIFIPLTFLAGIWGMNFKWMPELNWQYGYLIAWGLMLLSGILTWLYMKRKDWY